MKKNKNYKLWNKLLKKEWNLFLKRGPKGRFSHKGHKVAEWFGQEIMSRFEGKILDVGCGVMPLPVYMKYSKNTTWYGIDPLGKDIKRNFNFTHGTAEDLPYNDKTFDVVVYATSMDHLLNVPLAIEEAYRVLKPTGHVIVWTGLMSEKKYENWIKNGGAVDKSHIQGFTKDSLIKLFDKFVLIDYLVNGASHVLIFKKEK